MEEKTRAHGFVDYVNSQAEEFANYVQQNIGSLTSFEQHLERGSRDYVVAENIKVEMLKAMQSVYFYMALIAASAEMHALENHSTMLFIKMLRGIASSLDTYVRSDQIDHDTMFAESAKLVNEKLKQISGDIIIIPGSNQPPGVN